MVDPVIQKLEQEIQQSRFEKWDVENFLADRHMAKAEALTTTGNKLSAKLQVGKELADTVFILFGKVAAMVMLSSWLLTGSPLP